jgi:glycerophosphoryl diester phosphodiesterase
MAPKPKKGFSKLLMPFKVFATMSKDDEEDTPAAITENASNPYIMQYGHPLVSAHRAGAGIVPENTLMAFDLCLTSDKFEIDLFELDVHLTLDGELVVLHNSTFDATSNAVEAFGKKKIYPIDYTIEQLQVLNLGENFEQNGQYPFRGLRGDNIPENLRVHKLDDILDYVNEHGKKKHYFSIDVKNHGDLGRKAADRLYKVLGERNMYGNVIVASFNPSVSRHYDAACPGMRRSAGPPEVLKFYYYSRTGADLGKKGIKYSLLQIPYGAYRRRNGKEIINLGTREFINYAHANNIAVQYWTINNAEDMRKLRGNGCDCIMTDFPDMAYSVITNKQ